MTKIILCAGMNRSGSTWQFNIVREIIREVVPEASLSSGWVKTFQPCNSDFEVIKVHSVADVRTLSVHAVLTSFRDIREVAGSLIRMQWLTPDEASVRAFVSKYIANLVLWADAASFVMRYEDMLTNRIRTTVEIAQAIGLPLDNAGATAIVDRVDILRPKSAAPSGRHDRVDPVTLLHDGHTNDGNLPSAVFLPTDITASIEHKYGSWLEEHGYGVISR